MRFIGQESTFLSAPQALEDMYYRLEDRGGYDSGGRLWCPGGLQVALSFERPATLVASTEDMREGTRAFLEKRKPEFKGK